MTGDDNTFLIIWNSTFKMNSCTFDGGVFKIGYQLAILEIYDSLFDMNGA